MMASHYFDPQTNQMQELSPGSVSDLHTTFLILREGKVIFDGNAHELAHSQDEYIREYIS